jgi:putative hydrolase of the HAD superfamily
MKAKPVLLFDLGNVLLPIDLDKTYHAFAALSDKYNFLEIKRLITENALWQNYEAGLQSSLDFRHYLRDELSLKCTDKAFDDAFCALLLEFHEGVFKWLKSLSENYAIHLLSNTSEIHAKIFTKIPLGPQGESLFTLFGRVFYSFEMGLVKPSPQIYQHVLNELNIHPSDLLFFDDNLSNVVAAQKLGIQAVHILNPSQSIQQINLKLASLC